MSGDDYLGAMNWDSIYKAFHNPSNISDMILNELGRSGGDIIFAGFPDTARQLSCDCPLTFVDSSPAITAGVRNQQGDIRGVITGDICSFAAEKPAHNLIIVCRISAFWNSSEHFENLAGAIMAFPRQLILLDFYDVDLITPGTVMKFNAGSGSGSWHFGSVEESKSTFPALHTATMRISYSLPDNNVYYTAHRSFFQKSAIAEWAKKALKGYRAEIKPSLLASDPSFLLKLSPL